MYFIFISLLFLSLHLLVSILEILGPLDIHKLLTFSLIFLETFNSIITVLSLLLLSRIYI